MTRGIGGMLAAMAASAVAGTWGLEACLGASWEEAGTPCSPGAREGSADARFGGRIGGLFDDPTDDRSGGRTDAPSGARDDGPGSSHAEARAIDGIMGRNLFDTVAIEWWSDPLPAGRFKIPRSLFDHLLVSIPARPRARFALTGRGYQITSIEPGSYLRGLGLVLGDEIIEIDGHPLREATHSLPIYQPIRRIDDFCVLISRRGRLRELCYELTDERSAP